MENGIIRLYKHEDETMLVMAQVMHDNLVADLTTFTPFFPWLVASRVTVLQSSINAAKARLMIIRWKYQSSGGM